MARTSRGFHRVVGARASRRIPAGAVCPICQKRGISGQPVTHVVLSALSRNYACREHAEQATKLGYEVFEGTHTGRQP